MVDTDKLDTEAEGKAKLDDTELSDDLPKALQKVDLDLDDAPFLEEDKTEDAAPEAAPESTGASPAPEKTPPVSKKKLLLLVGALVLLLAGGTATYFLLRKPAAPPPAEVTPEPAPQPVPEPTPPPPPPPKPKPEIVIPMEPFLVEMTDPKGLTRFLSVRFTAVTQDPTVEMEFRRNIIVLRDAVYYYLKNKSMAFLTDKNNTDVLKKDVLSVINQFMGARPLDNLLIEDYLVK